MTESPLPEVVDPLDDDLDELMVTALEDCTGVLRAAACQNAGMSTSLHAHSELVDGFDREAGQTWIYPTNKEVREYQLSIVRKALLQNTLVCLPTGLGKTFIAAVLMYNYYRWFPRAKVIFMAPTKPLVAQQMEACYEVMGIPQAHMSEMTGSMSPTVREAAWREKRVFFLTPQIISNDISRDICPANLVRCVVIDEAHKALGNHAYVQVIQELLKYNKGGFRVLALSATPGSVYQQVCQVIQNLLVANVEIRGEDSPDILPYTHSRVLETVVVPLNDELQEAKKSLVDVIGVYVTRLHQRGCVAQTNPEQLSQYAMIKVRDRFRENVSATLSGFQRDMIEGDFAISISLFHALDLLQFYGLQSFNVYCQEMLQGGKGPPRTRYELQHNAMFCRLVDAIKRKLAIGMQPSPTTSTSLSPPYKFTGYSHPKFQKLEEIVLAHFADVENKETIAKTRIIVFAQYRECVREIEVVLSRHKPQVRPVVLLGQGQGSAGSNAQQQGKGLKQKVQVQVMTQFRSGQYNVLVSTCIGEEGLDIGDVDLIICFDALKSPVRLVQRMGRTGRKRAGRVVILMTKGKEEKSHKHGQYNSKAVSRSINSSAASYELYAGNPRMIPSDLEPVCHKMYLTCGTFIHKISERKFVPNPSKIRKLQIAETPYLTDDQLAEWKARYWMATKDVPRLKLDAKMLSLDSPIKTLPEKHPEQFHQKSGRVLSLSEWLPWQNVLQSTFLVGHSERTEIMVDTMKSLEVLQYQDGTQCEIDMASHLNMDDVLFPGEKENWRQGSIGGTTKRALIRSRTGGRDLVQRMWARHKTVPVTLPSDDDDFKTGAIGPLKMDIVEESPLLVNINVGNDVPEIDWNPTDSLTDAELGREFFRIPHKQTNCERWSSFFKKDGKISCANGVCLHQKSSSKRSVRTPPLPYLLGLLDEIDIEFFSFLHEDVKLSVIPTANSNFLFKTPKLVKPSRAMVPMSQTPGSPDRNKGMNDSLYSMTQLMNIIDHNASDLASARLSCSDQKNESLTIANRQTMIEVELENSNWELDAAMMKEFEIIPPSPKSSPITTTRFSSKSIVNLSRSTITSTPLVQTNVATTKLSPDTLSVSSLSDEAFPLKHVQKRLPYRRLLNLSDFDSDSKSTVDPKGFIDDEASVDNEVEQVSSDEISEQADSFDEAFINDAATQGVGCSEAMYLQSVKSPHCRPGAFKLFSAANGNARCGKESVFSQLKSSPESDYEEDSFCVGSSDEESASMLRPQKRRRIMVVNQDTSSSEEVDNRSAVKSDALIKHESASLNVTTSLALKTPLLCAQAPPVIILVDSQKIATSQNIISELRLKHKARVIIAQLGCCDYALGCRVAVESKAISDLVNKAQHKKLVDRVREMSANFERWVLIVETGTQDVNSAKAAFTSNLVNMLVCLVDAGRVIFTNSKEHTAEVLYDLACSESKAGHGLSLLTDPNNSDKFRFYRKLTSNNYVAALTLLDVFSSPNSLLQCSAEGIADRCKWPVERAETLYHNIHRNFNV